jgi:hypothetical protein
MTDPISSTSFEEKLRLATKMPAPRAEFLAGLRRRIASEPLLPDAHALRLAPGWRRPALLAPLAVLIVLVTGLAIIGPQRVIAAVGGLFGYIPGVGLVDRDAPIRVLAAPVTQTRDGVTLTVTAATLTPERTHVDYRIFGVPSSAYPDREDVIGCSTPEYLRLPDGTQLARTSDYPAVPAEVDHATLVIPCILNTLPGKAPENWEVELRFVPAPAGMTVVPVVVSTPLPSATPLPSQAAPAAQTAAPEANPLAITEVLDIGDKYVLMGEFRQDAILNQALPAGSWWALRQITIRGADGRDVPQSYSNDLQAPTPSAPDAAPWLYQLDKTFIPPVTIRYTGEVISPVGPQSRWNLNSTPARIRWRATPGRWIASSRWAATGCGWPPSNPARAATSSASSLTRARAQTRSGSRSLATAPTVGAVAGVTLFRRNSSCPFATPPCRAERRCRTAY